MVRGLWTRLRPWPSAAAGGCLFRCSRVFHSRPIRLLSTQSPVVEHVRVPCASSGEISVSLHNISKHDATTPLVIVIPPFSLPAPGAITPPLLPSCFHDYPAAVIHYRWQADGNHDRPGATTSPTPRHWPTPLHDVSFAYSWIMANLGSGDSQDADPRPAYVYGSYLGASLATGLALTEAHVPAPPLSMTIRGLIAHNGIYNWTTFLPDHPIHKLRLKAKSKGSPFSAIDDRPFSIEEKGIFTELKLQAPDLFADPSNLFDPFASACLFFHSANLHVPDDFTTPLSPPPSALSAEFTAAVDNLANRAVITDPTPPGSPESSSSDPASESADALFAKAALLAKQSKPPRKGYLVFPPRNSTLRLPHSLFLYSSPPFPSTSNNLPTGGSGRRSNSARYRNSFRAQATDLMSLMMRSLDMHELRPRSAAPWEWEADVEGYAGVAGDEEDARRRAIERRVQSFEISSREGQDEIDDGCDDGGHGEEAALGLGPGLGLGREGEAVVGEWLRERIDEDFGEDESRQEWG